MSRLRHYFAGVGLLAGLIALGLPWLTFSVSTGLTGSVAWGDMSAGSVSTVLAAAAGWGLSLLVVPTWRRIVGALVAVLAVASSVLAWSSLRAGPEAVVSQAESSSGVLGVFTIEDIVWSWSPAGVGFAAVAIGAFFFSGLAAVIWPGEKRERKRYERATRDPWDELSQGSDPTAR